MKKTFAAFCAIFLMPSFSAQAWIGGPFSNNAFFGVDGDDGVYEAVAYPIANKSPSRPTVKNGIGTFRWAVTNTKSFTDDVTTSVVTTVFDDQGNIAFTFVDVRPLTSNVYFGGVGQVAHTWFIEGVAYRGNCEGSVNSGLGSISCIGQASNVENTSQTVSSSFRAKFDGSGQGLPVSRFSGKGRGSAVNLLDPTATVPFRFMVFGSRVTNTITYNGQNG
jgi:hypothetical protein